MKRSGSEAVYLTNQMRRIFISILLTFCYSATYALHVKCVGSATQIVNQKTDTIFLFASEVHLATTDATPTDWYRISDNSVVATNTDEIYPDDGGYYILYNGAREYFYAFSYPVYQPRDLLLTVSPSCTATEVRVEATLPEIQ